MRHTIGLTAAAVVMGCAGAAGAPPLPPAWFQTPAPFAGVSSVDKPTFQARSGAYGPAPAAVRPKDDTRAALTGARMMADVRTIVGFSLERRAAGDFLWGRIS